MATINENVCVTGSSITRQYVSSGVDSGNVTSIEKHFNGGAVTINTTMNNYNVNRGRL